MASNTSRPADHRLRTAAPICFPAVLFPSGPVPALLPLDPASSSEAVARVANGPRVERLRERAAELATRGAAAEIGAVFLQGGGCTIFGAQLGSRLGAAAGANPGDVPGIARCMQPANLSPEIGRKKGRDSSKWRRSKAKREQRLLHQITRTQDQLSLFRLKAASGMLSAQQRECRNPCGNQPSQKRIFGANHCASASRFIRLHSVTYCNQDGVASEMEGITHL